MTRLADTAQRVAQHARAIASLEVELARLELRRKVAALGVAAFFLGAAALLGVLALWFVFAGVAAAFALILPEWAGWLVTAGILLLLAGIAVIGGLVALRSGTPPVPEQALEEARKTKEALKGNGRG